MLRTKDILDEKDKRLRMVSKEVIFPLSDKYKEAIELMKEYLTNSQIEKLADKYKLRPGMGMAAIQLGIPKRFLVIVHEQEIRETFKTYVVVNPKITSSSEEKIYVEEGEGCLSVNRPVDGIIPRCARITVEGFDEDGKPVKVRAREELAIAFQHEIDHLDGILFVDRIDKKHPFKDSDKYRAI